MSILPKCSRSLYGSIRVRCIVLFDRNTSSGKRHTQRCTPDRINTVRVFDEIFFFRFLHTTKSTRAKK